MILKISLKWEIIVVVSVSTGHRSAMYFQSILAFNKTRPDNWTLRNWGRNAKQWIWSPLVSFTSIGVFLIWLFTSKMSSGHVWNDQRPVMPNCCIVNLTWKPPPYSPLQRTNFMKLVGGGVTCRKIHRPWLLISRFHQHERAVLDNSFGRGNSFPSGTSALPGKSLSVYLLKGDAATV